MRTTYESDARPSGTLAELFADAITLIRQDAAEYGFTALLGAVGGCIAVVVLMAIGGPIATALAAPAGFTAALITYAMSCAAIRRVGENLSPDSLAAFGAVCVRAPAVIAPMLLPLGATFVGVLAAVFLQRYIGALPATLLAVAVTLAAAIPVLQRVLYIPALFARTANVWDAAARANQAMQAASGALYMLLAWALVPAALFALIALGSGFDTVAAALATLVFIGSMPLCAAIATLVFDRVAAATQPPAKARRPVPQKPPLEDRIARIRR